MPIIRTFRRRGAVDLSAIIRLALGVNDEDIAQFRWGVMEPKMPYGSALDSAAHLYQ